MTKVERKRLINKANEKFGRPFTLKNDDGDVQIFIQTPSDEQMFIDFGSSKVEWYASDMHMPGYESKGTVRL